jgi:DNA-binding transcriptional regulator WhiA
LSFLCGIILGDGHLSNEPKHRRIEIEMTSERIIRMILEKIRKVFLINVKIREVNRNRDTFHRKGWRIVFESKEIWYFLKEVFEIPCGKKSGIIRVPKIIFESDSECVKSFVEGVFLADGSQRKKSIKFSSASQDFIGDLERLLRKAGVCGRKRKFNNKKYNREFFEFVIIRKEAERFKLMFPGISIKLAGVA